jgi:AcrR family transcriptional regulator
MSDANRAQYHHGDLREALIATAIELIGERGVRDFSLAEASRRLGVAPSAPYAHFADRDALLVAVRMRAFQLFHDELKPVLERAPAARERLAHIVRSYVTFAAAHKALFQAMFRMDLDKTLHPELANTERPVEDAFRAAVSEVAAAHSPAGAERLAAAIEAAAHGHAELMLDGRFGQGRRAVDLAAESAAQSALAIADGWSQAPRPGARKRHA